MVVHHHEVEIPPDLQIARMGDLVVAHAEASRELVITIYPVTTLTAEHWIRRTLVDGTPHDVQSEACAIGSHRCERVTFRQSQLRRVVVFLVTRDGSNGRLPFVLASTDQRHDILFEAVVASARGTRSDPFSMWAE